MPRHTFATALGHCALSWSELGVSGFELPEAISRPGDITLPPPPILTLAGRVQRHMAGDLQDFADVSFDWSDLSEFQRQVYEAALAVKAGFVLSYGELTAALGLSRGAARAVGSALGSNPLPLLVPCHRFVGTGGKMVGFSGQGGVATKVRLLALEGAQLLAE
jgi:methylated-DNA-[protein]-cysteine S-methyltransferase